MSHFPRRPRWRRRERPRRRRPKRSSWYDCCTGAGEVAGPAQFQPSAGAPIFDCVILKDERAGLEHRLGEGGARLGRDPDLDIVFPEHEDVVSAIHCRVILKNGEWWLEDLGSTNGTWLEGRRISTPQKLSTGQRFSLGQRGPVLRVAIQGQVARTIAEPAEALAGGPLVRLRRLKGGEDLVGAGGEVVLGRASACTI